ncbi:MAG: ABC transporter permease [Deltaproteobacteria bacterium]|nr:MAG: ABC transporter permease [Deltaproteobacteria bacterium]
MLSFIHELGEFLFFTREFFHWLFQRPYRSSLIVQQMEFIGVRSLPIILLTGGFTGMVFGLQTGYAFRLFNAGSFVGSTVGLALTREIAPVFTALMVVARCGSAMAASIGTMKVTEQVDALTTMAVSPIHYLVVPRVVASVLMMPLLTGVFIGVGTFGAYIVATGLLNIDPNAFMQKLTYYVDFDDVFGGMIKAAVFGFFLSIISCERGYKTTKGAEGVGLSTTQAVVISSVSILIVDYFLTSWILEFFSGDM